MNQLEQGIYAALTSPNIAGTGLAVVPTGVHYGKAPHGAETPVIVFQKQAGTREFTFALQPAWREFLYVVKCVCDGAGAAPGSISPRKLADQVLDAVTTRLESGVTVTGHTVMLCRREGDLDYIEDVGGESYHHVGGIFRVLVDPT